MEAEEQFKQLDLSNAFLFSLAFSDPEACAQIGRASCRERV